jgi:Bacterial SH3 domain
MKKLLLTSIATLFLTTGPARATITTCAFVRPTPDGFLNLRAEPGMNGKVVRRVKSGQELFVVAETTLDPWTKVEAIVRNEKPVRGYLGAYANTRFLRFFHCDEQSDKPSSPLIEQSEPQGAWHCELPRAPGQLYARSVDIELRKYAVHDNEYSIRGEFPVWGNGESLSLNYTDDMEVVYFNGKPCQQIKNGQ